MWRPWREAMAEALYGERGFYRVAGGPAAHFRTSTQVGDHLALALLRLLDGIDEALGHPANLDVVDVGAGRGELLMALLAAAPPELRDRLRLVAVEMADRPDRLPASIGWRSAIPEGIHGLLVGHEWLDVVPLDVVESTAGGPRLVTVDNAGSERLGGAPSLADLAWLDEWWPLAEIGDRAEVGLSRDSAWAAAVSTVEAGVALAVDYVHLRTNRPAGGTLTAYRSGEQVRAVPDGSCDLTAHVAIDSVAAAGERVGVTGTRLTTQRAALRALGVDGGRPDRSLASRDPAAYLAALAGASEAAALTDPAGLGGFGWLAQSRGVDPGVLDALGPADPAVIVPS